MRGNHLRRAQATFIGRSIPAYAGEPLIPDPNIESFPVYPRVCGGTMVDAVKDLMGYGLSPRMRGNRIQPSEHLALYGSIPAYAGEPGRVS